MYTQSQFDTLKTASDYAISVFEKYPDEVKQLLTEYPLSDSITDAQLFSMVQNSLMTHDSADKSHDNDLATLYTQAVQKSLRQLRAILMLRWIWQDALGFISVEQLTHELSVFADACLSTAKKHGLMTLSTKYGAPLNKKNKPIELIIIAMGKLGAAELNLSSDIDLVFLYEDDGQTDITLVNNAASDSKQKSIDTKKFMTLWGQHVIKLIDQVTADGFVFRVDMRLRPWGDGSDLVCNFKKLSNYFQKHGRAWERFAWLKARIVSNELVAENNTLPPFNTQKNITNVNQLIEKFVFRYYVDYTAFSALREMKGLIIAQQRQRNDEDNIKLGAGGIRDIEFIVQSYQLIYGGMKTELRVKHCLTALDKISNAGLLDADATIELKNAYVFLRRIEHAIQALQDKQTQKLPTDSSSQTRIAKVLGYEDWSAFISALAKHRECVSEQFKYIVSDRQLDTNSSDTISTESVTAELTATAQQRMDEFFNSSLVANLSPIAKERLTLVWDDLLNAIAQAPDQELAVERVGTFLEAILTRSIYLVMLKENPDGLAHLVRMMTASPWIANELTRYPVLLDEFLLNRTRPLPDKSHLVDSLRQQLLRIESNDEEGQITAIRLFKKTEVLHVSAKDILANQTLMTVSDSLTWTAEAVLTHALQICYANLTARHGFPVLVHSEHQNTSDPQTVAQRASHAEMGFGIVGYGKLGGIELSYGSDLDLVFLHSINEVAETDGDKPISGLRFVTRLAKKLITLLSTQTRDGRAYEIDMRLRPSGNSGVMVSSLKAFANYQNKQAWLWEYQALVRARAICGDTDVLSGFDKIRHTTLAKERDLAQTRQEVIKMRQKMRDHLGSSSTDIDSGLFHLKHDTGGIVDIEFLAQFGVLTHCHNHPDIATFSDNVRIFTDLARIGFMSREEAELITKHYLTLRNATHQQALANQSTQVNAEPWQQIRADVRALWDKYVT